MFAFMVIGLNGRIPLNTAGNLAMRNRAGNSLLMHTSHLGNSPSEVDPTFALQNATNYYPNEGTPTPASSQIDNAGIQIAGTTVPDALGNLVFTPGDTVPPPQPRRRLITAQGFPSTSPSFGIFLPARARP